MKQRALATLLLALAAAVPLAANAAIVEELIELPSVGGARLPALLSRDDARAALATAVLFNGGGGKVGLRQRIPQPGANFLVRSRALFAARGIVTAVIDVPTDVEAMSDPYRMSARHADDVRALVAELRRRHPGLPVFLVGTSRGTVSAAYAGAALGKEVDAIDGVVLTSSVFNATRGGVGLSVFDWDSIRTRLLFVHHVDDGCHATPYSMAQKIAAKRTLVSVHGGDAPRSEPCEAFAQHGFLGMETPVVDAIVQWTRGEAPPAELR